MSSRVLTIRWFQHAAARRRLVLAVCFRNVSCLFQHAAARRRLGGIGFRRQLFRSVSTRSRPKAAGRKQQIKKGKCYVSTRSRPKAAGPPRFKAGCKGWFQHAAARRRLASMAIATGIRYSFNTQPPEGGWGRSWFVSVRLLCFNTQPPEGGWPANFQAHRPAHRVSTRSRPKAAGQ